MCTPLGLERLRTLTIHDGHYTFVNHALAGGRTLAEARLAARQAYPTGRAWRKWEDELVRSLPAAAVVRQTGRSISSVYSRRGVLNVSDSCRRGERGWPAMGRA
ncbi:MAG TPA: hypothetical protein VKE40_08165 [Gemmataceae bacterium]|nr:hypothetical protein [Gemmataceae bacterium]